MEPVPLNGLMDRCTLESSIITTSTAKEFTHGPMAASTKVNGATTKCTEREPSPGLTVESMSVNTLTIRSKDTVSSFGLMVDATKAIGRVVNSMVRECMLPAKAMKSTESGRTVSASDGSEERMVELEALNEIIYSSLVFFTAALCIFSREIIYS